MGPRLRLLGGFELRDREGTLVPVSASRVQSFLGWTALNSGRHDRGRLAELFWPDVSDAQARNNLRQLLHQVRRVWPAHGRDLHADEATVGWAEDVRVDVLEFERAFARAQDAWQRGDRGSARTALTAAAECYGGPLLPGAVGEWIPARREQLQRRCVQALDLLARLHEERREFPDAIAAARRMIDVDALGERGYLRLMRLHALDGDRAAALRVYETWVHVSRQELDAPPSPEMADAAARIAARTAAGPSRRADDAPRAAPLVGREVEWRGLLAAWERAQAGGPAITVLVGEAGVGKSRIAEELAAWAD